MSMSVEEFKEYIKELIKKELEEVSVTGALDGGEGPPKTPYAFYGGRKKDKEKKKKITQAAGYTKVNERITVSGYSEIGKRGRYLPLAAKEFMKALKKQDDKEVIKNIEYISDLMDYMKDTLANKRYNESVNEAKGKKAKVASYNVFGSMRELSFNLGKVIDIIDKDPHYRKLSSQLGNFKSAVENKLKSLQKPLKKVSADTMLESVNEGKYHDYRNDESMTPKQKIGRSMRDVRNSLSELSKVIDMNVRLKKELKVNSQSYWKNTHKALHKISERLVKLANKVGQLQ